MTDIQRVERIEARLVRHRWDWAEEKREAIAADWRRRVTEKPAIFNGRVLMLAATRRAGETLEADFFATDYANLLAWLDGGQPDRSVANGFAMGALQGADGGFLLGLMADHTATAGRLYFPAGTPDMADVRPRDVVDLAASLVREIVEETGLSPSELSVEPGWTIVRDGGRLAFMRRVRLPYPAEAAAERIRAHLAAETRPELADIVVVREIGQAEDLRMPSFLPPYLRLALRRQVQR